MSAVEMVVVCDEWTQPHLHFMCFRRVAMASDSTLCGGFWEVVVVTSDHVDCISI